MADFTIPGGKEKGRPIAEASTTTLGWWLNKFEDNIRSGSSRNEGYERAWIAAARAVLAVRGDGPPQQPQQQTQTQAHQQQQSFEPRETHAIARVDSAELQSVTGTFETPDACNAMLVHASRIGHLVSPAQSVGQLPLGTALAVTPVFIDVDKETYNLQGSLALDKVALEKIGDALGIDFTESYRTDDMRDPHYCAWTVRGEYRRLDGRVRTIIKSADIDARDGSTYTLLTQERAKQSGKPNKELEMTRQFLARQCESKAMNRVVRAAAKLRQKYTRDELQRPFIVVSLALTGRCPDRPDIEAIFAKQFSASFAPQRLYSRPTSASERMVAATPPLDAPENEYGYEDDDQEYGEGMPT